MLFGLTLTKVMVVVVLVFFFFGVPLMSFIVTILEKRRKLRARMESRRDPSWGGASRDGAGHGPSRPLRDAEPGRSRQGGRR